MEEIYWRTSVNETAKDIRNNIENIIYTPVWNTTEQDLNDLLKECLRMAELLVKITEEKQ